MHIRIHEFNLLIYRLQPFDGDALLTLIQQLIKIESRWIPNLPGYIRPTIIGTRSSKHWASFFNYSLFKFFSQVLKYLIIALGMSFLAHTSSEVGYFTLAIAWSEVVLDFRYTQRRRNFLSLISTTKGSVGSHLSTPTNISRLQRTADNANCDAENDADKETSFDFIG
jgi:hypothetical protein